MDSIIKIEHYDLPFTQIHNALLEDERLSFKAKGVVCYLLSKKSDWEVRISDLVNHSTDGKCAIYAALKELREVGYAKLEVVRSKKGTIETKVWRVQERPRPLNRDFLKQENLKQENRDISNTRKEEITKAGPDGPRSSGFSLNGGTKPKDSLAAKFTAKYAKFTVKRRWHVCQSGQAGPGGWSKQTLATWEKSISVLLQSYSKDEVIDAMRWYFQHWNDFVTQGTKGIPACRTLKTFCAKFQMVQDAMKRHQFPSNGRGEPDDGVGLGWIPRERLAEIRGEQPED